MKRWSFISGLTITLLLLLVMSGYCVWVTRGLTTDLEKIIADNYDTIRSVRDLRSAMTRINSRYLVSRNLDKLSLNQGVFDVESAFISDRLDATRRSSRQPGETILVDRMQTLLHDYFTNYRQLFLLTPKQAERLGILTEALGRGTQDVADIAQDLVEMNEHAIFARRDAAVERGRMFGWAALGIAAFSVLIYIYTSVRLTQGVFQPLRKLRDSMQRVRAREFDALAPIEGGEELEQISTAFNEMAGELRAYLAESDQRVVEANRVSRAILEALPYPIYIVDDEFKVRLKNPRAIELSAALKIKGHLPSAVRKCIDQAAALGCELIGDDLQRAVEIPLPDAPAGPTPTYLPQVFRMAAAPGTISGWAVLLMDVTKLRQFDQAKTKAIATLGHEVKTPVTSIRMTLHLLLEEKIGALTPDQRELVTAGRDDCERLLTVLQALLELAHLESGRVVMKPVPTAPGDLLLHADGMHGDYVRRLGIPLTIDEVPADLPLVHADEIHAVRILGNFLSNAAKYGIPGLPVTMHAELRADGFVRLSVRNRTSRPLSESDQAKVFEPFYRRPGEGAEGTGLGLTICREIAVAQNGRVGVWCSDDQVDFYLDLRIVVSSPPHVLGHTAALPAS
jgi:NtrC-family two-component system sensor histidine kinase KinB